MSILYSYQAERFSPLPLAPLLGRYAGGVRVDENFRGYLTDKLLDGEVGDQGEIAAMVLDGLTDFQHSTKLEFLSPQNVYKVHVGVRRLNDEGLGIKRGVMAILGCDINTHHTRRIKAHLTLDN